MKSLMILLGLISLSSAASAFDFKRDHHNKKDGSVTITLHYCQYFHKDKNAVYDFDFFGNQRRCDPKDHQWFEGCRDHSDETKEVGCR